MIDSDKIQAAFDVVRSMDQETRDAFARNVVKGVLAHARQNHRVAAHVVNDAAFAGAVVLMLDVSAVSTDPNEPHGLQIGLESWVSDDAAERTGRPIGEMLDQMTTAMTKLIGIITQGRTAIIVDAPAGVDPGAVSQPTPAPTGNEGN